MNNLSIIFSDFILKLNAFKKILKLIEPQNNITTTINTSEDLFELSQPNHKLTGQDVKKSGILFTMLKTLIPQPIAHNIENSIIYYAYNYKVNVLDEEIFYNVVNDINEIERIYKTTISKLVIEFDNDNITLQNVISNYNKFLSQSGILCSLSKVTQIVFNGLKKINTIDQFLFTITLNSDAYDLIKEYVSAYDRYRVHTVKEEIVFNMCDKCDIQLTVDCDKGELICMKCGLLIKLCGDVIETTDTIVQDTKPKNSSYAAPHHFDFWYKRIFALEPTELPDNIVPTVQVWLKKNSYNPSCENIRLALQKTKLSTYNTHVSLIHKLITGKSLEPPTYEIKIVMFNNFEKAIKVYNIIKKDNNIKYYPYFMWKIMEMIYFKDFRRKANILQYIHLQNGDTLRKNDKIWREICKIVPEFTFHATDPNMQYIYQD